MGLRKRAPILLAVLVGCSREAPPQTPPPADSGTTLDTPAADTPEDTDLQDTIVTVDTTPAPFDAGPAPRCDLTASARHVLDRTMDSRRTELAGLVPLGDGWATGFRTNVRGADGGASRDTLDLAALAPDGALRGTVRSVIDGAALQRDLGVLALTPAAMGARVFVGLTRGVPGAMDFTLGLTLLELDAAGAPRGAARELGQRLADPRAAVTPDGTTVLVATQLLRGLDAGAVLVRPVYLRLGPDGAMLGAGEIDLNNLLPAEATDLTLRAGAAGAILFFTQDSVVRFLRFTPAGVLDAFGVYVSRGMEVPRLDDAAVLGDGAVVVWSDHDGARATVRAAALTARGVVLRVLDLDRFEAGARPVVSVVPAYGGAAVTWVQGSGSGARVRAATVQPDGVLRAPAADLVAVPGAEGRVHASASGRALSFVVRDSTAAGPGVAFGRGCLGP